MSSPIPIDRAFSRPSKPDYSGSEDNVGANPGVAGLYPASVARMSPTLTRSFDPNDPSNLERQRTMDADVAIQLCACASPFSFLHFSFFLFSSFTALTVELTARARSASLAAARRPSNASPPVVCEQGVSAYAGSVNVLPTEEEDGTEAYNIHMDDHDHEARMRFLEPERVMNQAHDPALLVASPQRSGEATPHADHQVHHTEATHAPPPEYLPSVAYRNGFDFVPLEEFGRIEKERLNIVSPADSKPHSPEQDLRRRLVHVVQEQQGQAEEGQAPAEATVAAAAQSEETAGETSTSRRSRQRKLSYSHPQPRRGKLAQFESSLAASSTLHSQIPLTPSIDDGHRPHAQPHPPHISLSMGMGQDDAHLDRPYRFSFYSNALPSTIHARSLAELPAEGQTFEELFEGKRAGGKPLAAHTSMGSGYATPAARSVSRLGIGLGLGDPSGSAAATAPLPPRGPVVYDDEDANTWWLDVLSPTDEEMRVLSKVFGIHPLTTEDIQMEETREKIELFQNYYLVSFRSFDQNPYSPTHLEPINYYIVVFRKGTLSVRAVSGHLKVWVWHGF
jgi:magnesium transporter